MGEAAEMVLDGILDWDGSYSGDQVDTGKVYIESRNRGFKVKCFMKQRGIEKGEPQKKALADYAKHANCERPTFHAVNNWNHFKEFINQRAGYVKPSKKSKL